MEERHNKDTSSVKYDSELEVYESELRHIFEPVLK
jgi:hypothetical protein